MPITFGPAVIGDARDEAADLAAADIDGGDQAVLGCDARASS
jgi:hypothetical protein